MSTSQPLAGFMSQSAKPSLQRATPQAPAVQAATALAGAHARPQPPQWSVLARVSASQPLAGSMSQSAKPSLQVTSQRPDAQRAVALPPAAQRIPQPPQWPRSLRVSASQPLLASLSQSAKGAVHAPTAHAPVRHAGVPLVVVQARPQAPQWTVLACTSTQASLQQVWPVGHARVALHPATQTLPTQRLPGAQCSSARQSTQACAVGSQRRASVPPSAGVTQAMSSRQPARQRLPAPQ
ncbi:MAG: hypothetical protein U0326_36500 [Polyangiales bacterium]